MPQVHITETDRLNAIFRRAYEARTACPRIHNEEVAHKTGIPSRTLYHRLSDPSSLRVHELRSIAKTTHMSRDEIADFILGKEV